MLHHPVHSRPHPKTNCQSQSWAVLCWQVASHACFWPVRGSGRNQMIKPFRHISEVFPSLGVSMTALFIAIFRLCVIQGSWKRCYSWFQLALMLNGMMFAQFQHVKIDFLLLHCRLASSGGLVQGRAPWSRPCSAWQNPRVGFWWTASRRQSSACTPCARGCPSFRRCVS